MTTIPEGWELVPVEPTPAMEEAGGGAIAWDSSMYGGEIDKAVIDIYRAMLAAAPAAPEGATEAGEFAAELLAEIEKHAAGKVVKIDGESVCFVGNLRKVLRAFPAHTPAPPQKDLMGSSGTAVDRADGSQCLTTEPK
jgi:hypothetical protein